MSPGPGSPRPASASHSPPSPRQRRRHGKITLFPLHHCALLLPLLALLLLSSILEPVSAQASELAVTFLDSTGAAIGEPQTIPKTKCTVLNTASLVTQPPPPLSSPPPSPSAPPSETSPPPPSETDPGVPEVPEVPEDVPEEETPPVAMEAMVAAAAVGYASVTASDPQSALNLYSDPHCQVLASSAVGQWMNEGAVANIVAMRWEGTAPASMPPGTLSPNAFPPAMAVQTKVPEIEEWVMDPSKGKIVVGLVAAVMVIGVAIGAVQVYRAAQYVPPPKKYKAVSTGVVGIKKVKKKDAYFKKPVRDSMMSSASAPAGVGIGFITTSSAPASPRSSRMMADQSSRSPLMHERSRESHFSVASSSAPTLAPISSAGGYMDWSGGHHGSSGQGRRTNSHNNSDMHQNDAILIDMQDSSAFRRPWNSGGGSSNTGGGGGGQQTSSRQGTNSNGRISTSSTTLTDLMQFGHDSPAHIV
ncbi:hypothetical protein KVV02_005595 [Mortierella alpina]|uniref:Uncharacterized protein n=1 Tax=Mortierella alpina TaxID=64518 RepID=A0A9P8CVU2_MORAP|nr:hypothetical protein KVV02_005595 [Mortierella alpina]